MKVNGKDFKPFISKEELQQIVDRLAGEVNRDYRGRELMVCPILTGASIFAADLLRKLEIPCEVSFVRYSSYSGLASTGTVQCGLPFPPSVEGRDVLIVEDVVDSGLSMQVMLQHLDKLHPRSVRVCTLFFKPTAFRGDYKVDYVGREIGNEFIIGYGMDYDEKGRNLPEVLVIDE